MCLGYWQTPPSDYDTFARGYAGIASMLLIVRPRGLMLAPATPTPRSRRCFSRAALIGAIVIDYLAQWPFMMTPLFAIPVLVADSLRSP